MTVDNFVQRRRYPFPYLTVLALVICAVAVAAFVTVHSWQSNIDAAAPPPPPSVDPVQTGSVAGDDAIAGMIEKLDGQPGATTK